jgi:hypothetical protein
MFYDFSPNYLQSIIFNLSVGNQHPFTIVLVFNFIISVVPVYQFLEMVHAGLIESTHLCVLVSVCPFAASRDNPPKPIQKR